MAWWMSVRWSARASLAFASIGSFGCSPARPEPVSTVASATPPPAENAHRVADRPEREGAAATPAPDGSASRPATGSAPTACEERPRTSFEGVVVDRFDNRDFDDGGHRTRLTVKRDGKDVALVTDFGVEVAVGRRYTFFVDDSGPAPLLREIREGATTIWRAGGVYSIETGLDERPAGVLALSTDPPKAFSWPDGLARRLADGAAKYVVEIRYTDGAEGRCETLVGVGQHDPQATEEVFDPRLGAYEVPKLRWLWRASAPQG